MFGICLSLGWLIGRTEKNFSLFLNFLETNAASALRLCRVA